MRTWNIFKGSFRDGYRRGYASNRQVAPTQSMNPAVIDRMLCKLMATGRFTYLAVTASSHSKTKFVHGVLDEGRHYAEGTSGLYSYVVQCKSESQPITEMVAEQLHAMLEV